MAALPSKLSDVGFSLAVTNYGHIEQQATLAVTKAALLVAAQALLGGTYVAVAKDYKIFQKFAWTVEGWAFALAGFAILTAFLFSLYAILPKSKPDSKDDVLFFASINDNFSSPSAFARAYFQMDQNGFDMLLLENIYGKACWLRRHFNSVRISIACTFVGTVVAVAAVLAMSGKLSGTA